MYSLRAAPTEKIVKTDKYGDFTCFIQGDITNKQKILVVTMHDIGLNHASWVKFLRTKSMESFASKASFVHINAPGQQDKAENLPEGYVYPSMKQIAEEMPQILKNLGIDETRELIGVGEGAGSTIMVRFAGIAGKRILGMILLECTSGSAGFLEWAEGKFASWKLDKLHKMNPSTEKYLLWHHYGGRKATAEAAKEFHSSLHDRMNAHNLSLFINVFQSRTDITHCLKELTCPVLIVTGHDSPHISEVEKVFNALPKGEKTFLKAEDVGGDIKVEHPEKLAESMQYFIQGIGGLPSLPLTRLGRAASLGETPKEKRSHSMSMSEMDQPHADHHLKSADHETAAAAK
ncbi:protein NDRG1-like isoform X2 [Asterias amurensis]|uniref:protein NDRG1-like isoform X2 n=1 Tax=Asterias amurensis TaxID=7602 RepID=UPI003AB7E3FE